MSTSGVCPYCRDVLTPENRTREHVWPSSLGGGLVGDSLVVDACKRCNDLCGLYVDGPLVKSWFTKNDIAHSAMQYLDLERGTPMPMIYSGVLEDFDSSPYDTAELWGSLCRSRVLHLHSHRDDKYRTYASGNPIMRHQDPGAAIFLPAAPDLDWLRVGLRSFLKQFQKERRFVYGVSFSDEAQTQAFGSPPDEEHADLVARFIELDPGPFKFTTSIDLDFDERFLAKLGLGLGLRYLG